MKKCANSWERMSKWTKRGERLTNGKVCLKLRTRGKSQGITYMPKIIKYANDKNVLKPEKV